MDIEDLQVTAQLAHLNLDKAELAASFPAFEQMLGFFAAMQGADDDRAAFSVSLSELSGAVIAVESGHFRPDNAIQETALSNLHTNAGEQDGRFIVVPNVL